MPYTSGMDSVGQPARPAPPALTGILCALAVLVPYYGMAISSGIQIQAEGIGELPSLPDIVLQALVIFTLFCGLSFALLRFVCHETLADLSRPGGSWGSDILHAINISMLLLLGQFIIGMAAGVNTAESSEFNMLLGEQLNTSPLALLVWIGPVAWLQAAVTEEFTRAFILTRFWNAWPSRPAMFAVLVVMSFLFGCGHYYQGAPAVFGTFLIGLVFGLHYLSFRSLRAIILGHGIYDSMVMLFLMLGTRYAS